MTQNLIGVHFWGIERLPNCFPGFIYDVKNPPAIHTGEAQFLYVLISF